MFPRSKPGQPKQGLQKQQWHPKQQQGLKLGGRQEQRQQQPGQKRKRPRGDRPEGGGAKKSKGKGKSSKKTAPEVIAANLQIAQFAQRKQLNSDLKTWLHTGARSRGEPRPEIRGWVEELYGCEWNRIKKLCMPPTRSAAGASRGGSKSGRGKKKRQWR